LGGTTEIESLLFFVVLPKVTKASKEVRKAIDTSLMLQSDVYAIVPDLVTLSGATEKGSLLIFVALQKVIKASKKVRKAIDSSHI
jgi:hypothetical protein